MSAPEILHQVTPGFQNGHNDSLAFFTGHIREKAVQPSQLTVQPMDDFMPVYGMTRSHTQKKRKLFYTKLAGADRTAVHQYRQYKKLPTLLTVDLIQVGRNLYHLIVIGKLLHIRTLKGYSLGLHGNTQYVIIHRSRLRIQLTDDILQYIQISRRALFQAVGN